MLLEDGPSTWKVPTESPIMNTLISFQSDHATDFRENMPRSLRSRTHIDAPKCQKRVENTQPSGLHNTRFEGGAIKIDGLSLMPSFLCRWTLFHFRPPSVMARKRNDRVK